MSRDAFMQRVWRFVDRVKLAFHVGGRQRDHRNGALVGDLTEREALASGRAVMGRHSYGGFTVAVGAGDDAMVRIGAFCSIGAKAKFAVGGNHRTDWITTFPFRPLFGLPGAERDGHPRPEQNIEVENDVWIGAEALILPGVRIGDGAVVGARAVVTRDVRPYAIVAGNPAREIRRRFDDEQIASLLEVRWWDWPDEVIRSRVDLLCSPDVGRLLALGE